MTSRNPHPLTGRWTGAYRDGAAYRTAHLSVDPEDASARTFHGCLESQADGACRALILDDGSGIYTATLLVHHHVVLYRLQFAGPYLHGTRMVCGKRAGANSVLQQEVLLERDTSTQPARPTIPVPETVDPILLSSLQAASTGSDGFVPSEVTYHPYRNGLWNGYYEYGGDSVPFEMKLTFGRNWLRGECSDKGGAIASVEGWWEKLSGEVFWIKRYREDGLSCRYAGKPDNDGIVGQWSFEAPEQVARVQERGGPLRGAFKLWPADLRR
jgi:hypothetical protein